MLCNNFKAQYSHFFLPLKTKRCDIFAKQT